MATQREQRPPPPAILPSVRHTKRFFLACGTLRKRDGYAGGALCYSTRLIFNPVSKILRPGKAIVVASKDIALKMGKPKKVAWY